MSQLVTVLPSSIQIGVVRCCYPQMPIGKACIYSFIHLLRQEDSIKKHTSISFIVCVCVCLFVCTATDFSTKDKPSGVKFYRAVRRRPRQGISHFCELSSPRSPKSDLL